MDIKLQERLVEIALESAVACFGEPMHMTKHSVWFRNEETGVIKKITFDQMVKTLNESIAVIRSK